MYTQYASQTITDQQTLIQIFQASTDQLGDQFHLEEKIGSIIELRAPIISSCSERYFSDGHFKIDLLSVDIDSVKRKQVAIRGPICLLFVFL